MSKGGDSGDNYDYWTDPEHQPMPSMPEEVVQRTIELSFPVFLIIIIFFFFFFFVFQPDPFADLPVAERVVKYKEEGNRFLNKDTEKAIMWYTRAIKAPHSVVEDRAVFYCNRAAAHLLLKNYRSALEDTESALALNPSAELRLKALYRGSKGVNFVLFSHLALSHQTDKTVLVEGVR
jgi:hypothetical protein